MLNKKALSAAFGVEKDANFNQTVLLLHGDGTNGAQNNTFTDSSTNNFTITRNGNTTQGTFSPFSVAAGEWSNYFDGSGDYLRIAANSAFNYGTGDFTVECWFNLGAKTAGQAPISQLPSVSDGAWRLSTQNFSNQDRVNLTVRVSGSWVDVFDISQTWNIGTWYHLAIARSGSTLKAFVNGSEVGSTTFSSQFGGATYATDIGYLTNDLVHFTGYISNVRLVKGTAVYTGAFTVPTTPLTAITNTSLLTCQSNRFVDNSTNAFALTVGGNPSVQPFSPFAPSAAYSASTNGGSGYFDGTGDYLSVANNAAFNFGSGAFTVEAWIYFTAALGAQHCIISNYGSSTTGWAIQTQGSSYLTASLSGDGFDITGSTALVPYTWYHVALSGTPGATGIKLFLNGVQQGSTYTGAVSLDTSSQLEIGSIAGGTNFVGYITNVRLLKGTAQYTAAFTPPTAPLTAITNTSLLCNFTGAAIFDQTGKNNLETVGNAQIDTTTKKFGTGSLEFDGTGDYLIAPASTNTDLGTGNFTIEYWFYGNNFSTLQTHFSLISGTDPVQGIVVRTSTSSKIALVFYDNAGSAASGFPVGDSTTLSATTWYHVAVVRNGNTFTLYLNGTSEGSPATFSGSMYANKRLTIGRWTDFTDRDFNGYIDDFRITKGVARYTANFTPPAKAFADQ